MLKEIPCMIFRGGTSKGLFFLDSDLPSSMEERNRVLLKLMGSPDPRQIDGLGGATSVTSKVAILKPSCREDADVEYTFAQVSVDKALVSYAGNCGNISAAVGPFAIESGLVKPSPDVTTVRILNTNTQKLMLEDVMTPQGRVEYSGTYAIAGVPGTAAPVRIMVRDPGGSVCGALLPTGNCVDELDVPGLGRIRASFVDAANPLVFVLAEEVRMNGTEGAGEIDQNPKLLALLERVRGAAAQRLGLIEDPGESAVKTPGVPKLAIVSRPQAYTSGDGRRIHADQMDLCARMMSMQKAHPTYAMTGAMCTAAAAAVPGTLVNQVCRASVRTDRVRIGHPNGIIEAGAEAVATNGSVDIVSASGYRTARLLARCTAFYSDEP